MPTKLSVFNEALRLLGQPLMSNPDSTGEDGRQMRDAYVGAVNWCFEQGSWNFAIVRQQLARDAAVPSWGYKYYYQLPPDYRRTVEISETGYPGSALLAFEVEDGKIATNAEMVYLKYISSELLTLTPGEWSQSFSDYVSAVLALRTCPKLNANAMNEVNAAVKSYRLIALANDAIQSPPQRRQPGAFVQAIRGNRNSYQRGGSNG